MKVKQNTRLWPSRLLLAAPALELVLGLVGPASVKLG